jgi:hypothetical protein
MREQRLFNYYPQLTPSERLRLAVQAAGRGDEPELKRLMDSCPRVQVTMDDPWVCHRLSSIQRIGGIFATRWFQARHWQACLDLAGMMGGAQLSFEDGFRAGLVAAGAQPDATMDGGVPEIDPEIAQLAAKAIARREEAVACLKGLYAGLERFCAAVDLPIKDFLAWAPSAALWEDIAASQVVVDNDMEPDADVADSFYGMCCQLWPEPVAAPASTPVGRPERRPRRRATRTAKQIRPRDRAPLAAVRTTSEELRIPSPAPGKPAASDAEQATVTFAPAKTSEPQVDRPGDG